MKKKYMVIEMTTLVKVPKDIDMTVWLYKLTEGNRADGIQFVNPSWRKIKKNKVIDLLFGYSL